VRYPLLCTSSTPAQPVWPEVTEHFVKHCRGYRPMEAALTMEAIAIGAEQPLARRAWTALAAREDFGQDAAAVLQRTAALLSQPLPAPLAHSRRSVAHERSGMLQALEERLAGGLAALGLPFAVTTVAGCYKGLVVRDELYLKPSSEYGEHIDNERSYPLCGAEHMRDCIVRSAGLEVLRVYPEDVGRGGVERYLRRALRW